jgi:hypothetical protein
LQIKREGSTKHNKDAGLESIRMERRKNEIDDLKYFSI